MADPADLGLPTRESEAREWIEAAIMLLTKDGVDIVLTGHPPWRGMTGGDLRANVAGPLRVMGDLDGLKWSCEPTFDVDKGVEIAGFEARTPEGMLIARNPLHREAFPARGTYRLQLVLDFYDFPLHG